MHQAITVILAGDVACVGDGSQIRPNIPQMVDNLVVILPNILGNKLPTSLKKLGKFSASGTSNVSTTAVEAAFTMSTQLGNVISNLEIQNIDNIDKASYIGNVILENFDIGTLIEQKDLGRVTMNIDVDGKGFKQKYLNTAIKGDVSKIDYKNYTYSNIVVDGTLKSPKYKGQSWGNLLKKCIVSESEFIRFSLRLLSIGW